MNLHHKLLLPFFAILLFLPSCNNPLFSDEEDEPKDDPKFFHCLVNGEEFEPDGSVGTYPSNPYAKYDERYGGLSISAINIDNNNELIRLAADGSVYEVGKYDMLYFSAYAFGNLGVDKERYLLDTTLSYQLLISKLDIEEDRIEGTFHGTFVNEKDSTDIVEITNGAFSLTYYL